MAEPHSLCACSMAEMARWWRWRRGSLQKVPTNHAESWQQQRHVRRPSPAVYMYNATATPHHPTAPRGQSLVDCLCCATSYTTANHRHLFRSATKNRTRCQNVSKKKNMTSPKSSACTSLPATPCSPATQCNSKKKIVFGLCRSNDAIDTRKGSLISTLITHTWND